MMSQKEKLVALFNRLEGAWRGEGNVAFPTIETFKYRENLIFEKRNETTLSYQLRTEKRPFNQTNFQPSHWENGFIRLLPSGELELINVQSGGRIEVLIGTTDFLDPQIRLNFISRMLANDERVIASSRTIEIEGDTLRYEMLMHTTLVDHLTTHLSAVLQKVQP